MHPSRLGGALYAFSKHSSFGTASIELPVYSYWNHICSIYSLLEKRNKHPVACKLRDDTPVCSKPKLPEGRVILVNDESAMAFRETSLKKSFENIKKKNNIQEIYATHCFNFISPDPASSCFDFHLHRAVDKKTS